jgi:hypothetical protein
MRGIIPPFLSIFSWRCAQLRTILTTLNQKLDNSLFLKFVLDKSIPLQAILINIRKMTFTLLFPTNTQYIYAHF